MAFFGRVGNILKQASSRKINSELCSFPSGFQAIRCFSNSPSTKLFIGGVSYNMDDQSLAEAFSKYCLVLDARIIKDHDSGRSRGFGFVTYSTVEEASNAILALNEVELHGRQVKVNFANERPRGNSPYDGGAYGNTGGNATEGLNTTGGGYGYGSFPSGNTFNDETSGGYGANNGNYAAAAGVGESNTVNYGSASGGDFGDGGGGGGGCGGGGDGDGGGGDGGF